MLGDRLEGLAEMFGAFGKLLLTHRVTETRVHSGGQRMLDSLAPLESHGHYPGQIFRRLHWPKLVECERSLLMRVLVQRGDEIPFRGEIPVYRWNRNAGFPGYQRNGKLSDTVSCHDLDQTIQNTGACLTGPFLTQRTAVSPCLCRLRSF